MVKMNEKYIIKIKKEKMVMSLVRSLKIKQVSTGHSITIPWHQSASAALYSTRVKRNRSSQDFHCRGAVTGVVNATIDVGRKKCPCRR